ncbi:MAG TPA: heavy metal translocating P-type ATPase metal-binding domain-containing protein, partial [Cyclobacteriaceae bacterium]|nr:heavy metal translocating P-type ATPase metal-binding domain-containing protein [Cyclobacteriaceae bacterium]
MIATSKQLTCYHCGQSCSDEEFKSDDKNFCCYGCKVVFEIINDNNLCEYYKIESHPGLNAANSHHKQYEELDEPSVRKKLLEFDSDDFARVRFRIPAIHCSSCIWLLESLQKADKGVSRSEVNFQRKEVCIDFNPWETSLSKIAAFLDALGYPPVVTTEPDKKKENKANLQLVLKLG